MCRRRRGDGECNCCPACGEHSYGKHGGECLYCNPPKVGQGAKKKRATPKPRKQTAKQQAAAEKDRLLQERYNLALRGGEQHEQVEPEAAMDQSPRSQD